MSIPIPENLTNDEKDVLEEFQKAVGLRFAELHICVDQGKLQWIYNTHKKRGNELRARKLRESTNA